METYTASRAKYNAARTQIEGDLHINLAWWDIPASQRKERSHFSPLALSEYLIDSIPSPSIGAINQYVWMAAFAETKETFGLALDNLMGLLPNDFGGEDFSMGLPDPRFN